MSNEKGDMTPLQKEGVNQKFRTSPMKSNKQMVQLTIVREQLELTP